MPPAARMLYGAFPALSGGGSYRGVAHYKVFDPSAVVHGEAVTRGMVMPSTEGPWTAVDVGKSVAYLDELSEQLNLTVAKDAPRPSIGPSKWAWREWARKRAAATASPSPA